MTTIQQLLDLKLWVPLIAIVLPLAVAFVTKRSTHPGVQGVLFSLFAAILGVVSAAVLASQHDVGFNWSTAFVAAIGAWITGQTAHTSLFKSLGWSHAIQSVGPVKDGGPVVVVEPGHVVQEPPNRG